MKAPDGLDGSSAKDHAASALGLKIDLDRHIIYAVNIFLYEQKKRRCLNSSIAAAMKLAILFEVGVLGDAVQEGENR